MKFCPVGKLTIYKASARHMFARQRLQGYPLVVGSKGVFRPVQVFLRYRAVRNSRSNGTLWDEAYILRRWFAYLDQKKLVWTSANDLLLTRFVKMRLGEVTMARLQRQVDVIWNFYWIAQEELGLVRGAVQNPERGEIERHIPISSVLTHKRTKSGSVQRRLGSSIDFGTIPQGLPRPTPNDGQVEQILEALLSSSKRERGSAWWLMANWMYRSTLRCMGVAGLTLRALSNALLVEGIKPAPRRAYDLASLSAYSEIQDDIKLRLSKLAERGRSELYVAVTEKRGKQRFVPVPIDLFELNLDYIWSDRAWLMTLFARRAGYKATDALFPSLKTGLAYQPTSISNLINAQFGKEDIPGSAHRLRAACCTHVMRVCYIKARALHGRAWDRETVLLQVAEVMGHSDPETLRPYLTRVENEENLLAGEPLVVPVQTGDMFRGLASALEVDNGELRTRLKEFMTFEGVAELGLSRSLDDIRAAFRSKELT